jgi:stage II sporulation protein AA (anti-sigma F factor antagonist)
MSQVQSFRVTKQEIDSGYEIRVEGELDLAVADRLQEAIARCADRQTLIDLEDCKFIDSTGIAVIVRAYRERADDGGPRLIVHSPSDQVMRVLAATGLTGIGLVFGSREEALGAPALQS